MKSKTVYAGRLIIEKGPAVSCYEDTPYLLLCALEREAKKLDEAGKRFTITTWKYRKMVEEEA